MFDEIENDIMKLNVNSKYDLILLGDFNAYTANIPDVVLYNDKLLDATGSNVLKDIDMDNNELFNIPTTRATQDAHKPNNSGYRLIEMCNKLPVVILNGRKGDDNNVGKHTSTGGSVIDYALVSPSLFSRVCNFKVHDFNAMFSDKHSAIEIKLTVHCEIENDNFINAEIDTTGRLVIDQCKWPDFSRNLNKDSIMELKTQ
jgi:hypothetical protein